MVKEDEAWYVEEVGVGAGAVIHHVPCMSLSPQSRGMCLE